MRREVICAVLGLVAGAAPFAVGGDLDEELTERLRALQRALDETMLHRPVADNLPPLDGRGLEFSVLALQDLVVGIRDAVRPDHRSLRHKDSEWPMFGGIAEEAPQPFGTTEELMELVRGSVWPESWEAGGTITSFGPRIMIHQKPNVLRDVRRFLDQNLRGKSHRSVMVETDVVEVSVEMLPALQAGKGSTLSAAQRLMLTDAVKAQTATRVFRGRITGLLGQRVLLWHGQQASILADTDVEVAQSAKTADPIIGVVQDGGYLYVRPALAGSPERLHINLEVRFDQLSDPIERRETRENGVVEMPKIDQTESTSTLNMPPRTWAMVGSGVTRSGKVRVVLVRGEFLARGGVR